MRDGGRCQIEFVRNGLKRQFTFLPKSFDSSAQGLIHKLKKYMQIAFTSSLFCLSGAHNNHCVSSAIGGWPQGSAFSSRASTFRSQVPEPDRRKSTRCGIPNRVPNVRFSPPGSSGKTWRPCASSAHQIPSPRSRPICQEIPPSVTSPTTSRPRLRSITGRQGTRVNSWAFSTRAYRPDASCIASR